MYNGTIQDFVAYANDVPNLRTTIFQIVEYLVCIYY